MKKIILIPLLLFNICSFGQSYLTLIGNSYIEAQGERMKRINKPILLTYSENYCGFLIEGQQLITFPAVSYTTNLLSGGTIDESFISA